MIFCKNCGLIDDYHIDSKGKSVCNGCDKPILKLKNNAITHESIIHFGKYKGRMMKEIPNDYLKWCYQNLNLNAKLREYIESLKL
jgi:uncharacterized protein (DUF3820 family)